MTTASRSLAKALWGARCASGLLSRNYTTPWDVTYVDLMRRIFDVMKDGWVWRPRDLFDVQGFAWVARD
ncbi:hypothetical protein M2322_004551 [Rhodoblastus acidophilus]|uniref:hypothetical protein n=1 Tax=Rhodoblastus acidophilus TaxID=1074 RepID=UPI002225286D|nr:hypothetical protein [Rhodoblastus acidophilus]MCW2318982.1 hypothetical protein [Rhodoblastus acidophilus]